MRRLAFTMIAATFILGSCGNKNTEGEKTNQVITAGEYSCPMHAEITSDKPGTCSKCGMDLVKKQEGGEAAGDTTAKM